MVYLLIAAQKENCSGRYEKNYILLAIYKEYVLNISFESTLELSALQFRPKVNIELDMHYRDCIFDLVVHKREVYKATDQITKFPKSKWNLKNTIPVIEVPKFGYFNGNNCIIMMSTVRMNKNRAESTRIFKMTRF